MTIDTAERARERGIALVYVGIFLVPLLICTGLAVDLGRGYLVRATLAKAVDAAALEATRNITANDSSLWEQIANNIFYANFPRGFLGVTPSPPHLDPGFAPDGSHTITVSSTALVPTTFMRLAGRDSLEVTATGTATRRVVDMAFVIDRSKSLIGSFSDVLADAEEFVHSGFDKGADRIALITFSTGTTVAVPIRHPDRGFDPGEIDAAFASTASIGANGATATAEALYEAWDQLRLVPRESQNGLRIVVLFTDGSPNSFPGKFNVMNPTFDRRVCDPTTPWRDNPVKGTLGTQDYPRLSGTKDNSTSSTPLDYGLFDTHSPTFDCLSPTKKPFCTAWAAQPPGSPDQLKQNPCIPYLPFDSFHPGQFSGIPLSFPLVSSLRGQRPLNDLDLARGYRNYWLNANKAARNLAETIADRIRSDPDGNPIRIYTLGLGELLEVPGGYSPAETGVSILQRIANDSASADYNSAEREGKFFYAARPEDLSAAFAKVRDEVVRLSQ